MQGYYAKFKGRASMKLILQAANMTVAHFPVLTRYMKGKRNTMCYLHLLGICSRGVHCNRYDRHTTKGKLPDGFATEVIQLITPRVE